MVSFEELAALDLQIWLRTGKHAARVCRCNQSTISRRVERTLVAFGARLTRRGGEWSVKGPAPLLAMERELHQRARFLGHQPLRLEIGPYLAPLIAQPAPPGWMLGGNDMIGVRRPLQLLRERVIDAWLIDDRVDLPADADPEISRFDLFSYPLWLAGAADHPLAGVRGVPLADLRRFPVPQLSPDLYPNTALRFAELALAGPLQRARCYDPGDWEGRTADAATLLYANSFNLATHPWLNRIDSPPLLTNGVALVVRRDCRDQGPILTLKDELEERLLVWRPRLPDLERSPA